MDTDHNSNGMTHRITHYLNDSYSEKEDDPKQSHDSGLGKAALTENESNIESTRQPVQASPSDGITTGTNQVVIFII